MVKTIILVSFSLLGIGPMMGAGAPPGETGADTGRGRQDRAIVFVHEAVMRDGTPEIGRLRPFNVGSTTVDGWTADADAVAAVLDWVDGLPVADRARLEWNRFAPTLLDLDVDGDQSTEPVFLSIEFPSAGEFRRRSRSSASGEIEERFYVGGLLRRVVSARRVSEIDHDGDGIETRSRTFVNEGGIDSPIRGRLVEESRTVDAWIRATSTATDPHAPRIAKVSSNFVTGESRREVYGLFPRPVETADGRFVVRNRFDGNGVLESSDIFENGIVDDDFTRDLRDRLLNPKPGRLRHRITPRASEVSPSSGKVGLLAFDRWDAVLERRSIEIVDPANWGRVVERVHEDTLGDGRGVTVVTGFEYDEGFHLGLVPVRSRTRTRSDDTLLESAAFTRFDPEARILHGTRSDHTTGRTVECRWTENQEAPAWVRTRLRTTEVTYDRAGSSFEARTVANDSGEELVREAGRFETATGTWVIERRTWWQPGVPLRDETIVHSRWGRLLATRVGDPGEQIETRPRYDDRGVEIGRETVWLAGDESDATGTVVRIEDEYQWQGGEKLSTTTTFIDGGAHDRYRTRRDDEGRLVEDGIRGIDGRPVSLRTAIVYHGATERVLQAEVLQGDVVRERREPVGVTGSPEEGFTLEMAVDPFWGKRRTEHFPLGDPLGRMREVHAGDGGWSHVAEWCEGSAIARRIETFDPRGRLIEESRITPNAGTWNGAVFDVIDRWRIGFAGGRGLIQSKAVVAGTEVGLFVQEPGRRTVFDLGLPMDLPAYVEDPACVRGVRAKLGVGIRESVLSAFSHRLLDPEEQAGDGRRLVLDEVMLGGAFGVSAGRRIFDDAGRLLEEWSASIPLRGGARALRSDGLVLGEEMLQSIDEALRGRAIRVAYSYEPAWLIQHIDPTTRSPSIEFARNEPEQHGGMINGGDRRDLPTRIEWYSVDAPGNQRLAGHASIQAELGSNPYCPDLESAWTTWEAVELDEDGDADFTSERVVDAKGRIVTLIERKGTSRGGTGVRATHRIPRPDRVSLVPVNGPDLELGLELDARALEDFSSCDFVFVYVRGLRSGRCGLDFLDASGVSVRLTEDVSAPGEHPLWPIDGGAVEWLPDAAHPIRGASLEADWAAGADFALLAASVPQLAAAGLDVSRVTSIRLFGEPAEGGSPAVSEVCRLTGRERAGAEKAPRIVSIDRIRHASGIGATSIHRDDGGPLDRLLPRIRWNADLRLWGAAIGRIRPRQDAEWYPAIYFEDHTDPLGARPLYCIGADDGAFIEHYAVARSGDVGVVTIPVGFSPPKMEVYRSSVLDDELSPGALAYGTELSIGAPLVKGEGNLRNRMAFSIFKLIGDQVGLTRPDPELERLRAEANASRPADAAAQAAEVDTLPLLAEVVLASRTLPWSGGGDPPSGDAAAGLRVPDGLDVELAYRRLAFPNTYLVSTDPGTVVDPIVDTVREAALIELAACLGDANMARELLGFYWGQSDQGATPLHASYDARSGASTRLLPRYERESASPQTAEANLAMARAALTLGARTGDDSVLQFARRLIEILLQEFRPDDESRREIGASGLVETRVTKRERKFGLQLWPAPWRMKVETNARAYLAFRRALEISKEQTRGEFADPEWRGRLERAVAGQEAWLQTVVLPFVEKTGVVPVAWFEIEHIQSGTSAMVAERWTSAGGWLAFIEAADAMGTGRETTASWLSNLARVHGVEVGGVWGIDWSLGLTRPDAVSVSDTAEFLRVAGRIGHEAAAGFAASHLVRLQDDEGWLPSAVTDEVPSGEFSTGQGDWRYAQSGGDAWPRSAVALYEIGRAKFGWPESIVGVGNPETAGEADPRPLFSIQRRPDLSVFLWMVAGFYLSILGVSILWWLLRNARERRRNRLDPAGQVGALVSPAVMARAEERWAKRVLGAVSPAGCEHTRFSNAPVEGNFIIQLKALSKLIIEWRRSEQGWDQDDARIAESADDEWLNGSDEFVALVAIYMRWVIKAGRKDGFPRDDVLAENEDSNHIWSRLLLYFSEYYWGMLSLLENYRRATDRKERTEVNQQIVLLLNAMGMRQRAAPFDGRVLFDVPGNPDAFDLLIVQDPAATLENVVDAMQARLGIPRRTIVGFIRKYKDFKRREQPYPVHPFLVEAAKLLPHFVIMALFGIVWYNSEVGGLRILPYMEVLLYQLMAPESLAWVVPLGLGYGLSVAAHYIDIYRYQASMRPKLASELLVFSSITSLFTKDYVILPLTRPGRRWDPLWYARAGWMLRGVGFAILGWQLFMLPVATFAAFLIIKGLLAFLVLVEAVALLVPLATSWISRWWTDRAGPGGGGGVVVRLLNELNITPTRPTSFAWLAIKYHYQFSVPSGGLAAMAQAVLFYFGFAAVFILVGGYILKEVLGVWFVDVYQHGWYVRLIVGGVIFLNTMYLLRFGLYILATAIAAACATFPLRAPIGLAAVLAAVWAGLDGSVAGALGRSTWTWPVVGGLVAVLFLERRIVRMSGSIPPMRALAERRSERQAAHVRDYVEDPGRSFGVVYMSGDELSYHKLRPGILIPRWQVLEGKLGSRSARLLEALHGIEGSAALAARLGELSELEARHDVTLWHPMQIAVAGDPGGLPTELGLHMTVSSQQERERLLDAWHIRRWLVSMMSTAGNSQDTGINLVDIALRLDREGLSQRVVFYLIQNKYDARADNRPSQMRYDAGELGQREKLARLLRLAAPGSRAFNLNDWTPFGFKAGGLISMDLVYEESLKLTNMLVLDRNATVHDLEALMEDIRTAITDPGIVNVIPGRSTTNTLTPIGQGSQALEEGHRQLLKGVMLLGGRAGEAVGTGWGNIQAIYYGRVQAAMMNLRTSQRPLTTRQLRGCSFGDRFEGMIGFAPHAVGISEDTWAVTQATHNAIALGLRVKFVRSQALWHKIRETWSHADWFSAFPRWAGGYFQMMQDPIMQRINDDGPLTVFAKEVRANNGRFFLSVPFAIFNILIMPLAIIWGVSPFVQILIVLWNVGFLMNQILTTLGLVSTLESAGFSRATGAAGAALAGVGALAAGAGAAWPPLLCLLGFVAGGFAIGLSRWILDRGRDIIMFGPQLVIHAIGQFVRQSLEFVVSGAAASDAEGVNMAFRAWVGPREQQPWARYANPVNLRTLVWGVGLISVLLNALALRELDFLNVVLLLPSLLFSVSCLAGPFLMQPKAGSAVGEGSAVPKLLGWIVGAAIFVLVGSMLGQRGTMEAGGIVVLLAAFGVVGAHGLRYAGYSGRLRRSVRVLAERMSRGRDRELPVAASEDLAKGAVGGIEAVDSMLDRLDLDTAARDEVRSLVAERIMPLVREPGEHARKSARMGAMPRLACEFRRSLTLALFTFVWFLLVPVPGVLVFSAASHRVSIALGSFVAIVAGLIVAVLVFAAVGRLCERLAWSGVGGGGMRARAGRLYGRFRQLAAAPGRLAPADASALFAGFTDFQTYLDQRAYGYASRVLDAIESALADASATEITPAGRRRDAREGVEAGSSPPEEA